MHITQTGIAVGAALIVLAIIFVFPGLLPFKNVDLSASPGTSTNEQSSQPMTTSNELQITDLVVGTGTTAAPGNAVTVHYIGSLVNGSVFDASANHGTQGFTFPLGAGQVIKGWDQGIVGMKEGGKRRLVIPASLGYGEQGYPGVIPPNATLIFEVELVKVGK